MLCYKDMTFCTAIDCVNLECKRNMNREDFTPDSFWKDKIAQSDFRKICKQYYKENNPKKENKNEESGHENQNRIC